MIPACMDSREKAKASVEKSKQLEQRKTKNHLPFSRKVLYNLAALVFVY